MSEKKPLYHTKEEWQRQNFATESKDIQLNAFLETSDKLHFRLT